MTTIILTILAIISALIHMWGEYQGPDILIYLFKPLTMVFIISIAVLANNPPSKRYKYAVIAGLLFSITGDIFLMLPDVKFLPGLISFLFAHIAYILGFNSSIPDLSFAGLILAILV